MVKGSHCGHRRIWKGNRKNDRRGESLYMASTTPEEAVDDAREIGSGQVMGRAR
ncbi:hypothetical protein HPP92_017343 [Vanilla planifolia]|uniref:Uncharacterized protein n=1 Tax=Vanilla planifolia TaxID=51239 RepID=A0A835QL61_VANPL|nr:hypothetical protein HPP92_017343 [Vanilla planifolia]